MSPAQLLLLAPKAAPAQAGVDLRCCSVEDLLPTVCGARLVIADPPWRYAREAGVANPETNGIYSGLDERTIASHLDAAYDAAGTSARLVCWYTWPKESEWVAAGAAGPRWGGKVTGGAWLKTGHSGVGFHWRGWTEPVALFTKGATGRPNHFIGNGWSSPPDAHSEKPLGWIRSWITAWTDPGDLVLDLYAGTGVVAAACLLEGRAYVGAEIDPGRHAIAMTRLCGVRR